MNRKRLRRCLFAATSALVATTLASCAAGGQASSAQGKDGDVTLTFLTFETPNLGASYWDAAIARASAKVPGVKIKKLVAPTTDRTSYAKQLATSGQMPDLMISVDPSGFAQAGELVPFTDQELADYEFPHANPINGKIYQLPYNTQPTPLVYYNKSDFAKAGISAPTSYAELLTDCAKLKAAGITPFVVGGGGADTFAAGYPWIATVATDVYKKTPDWLSERASGKVKFTDPSFTAATQKIADLASKGYIDKAGLSRSYAETEDAFRAGAGAMYPMGSWFAASADSKKPNFDVGVFAWPSDDGQGIVPSYTGGGISVSSSAKNVALAKKWALAFMSDKQNLDASVKSDGSIIALKGYTPPPMGPVYNETVKVFNDALKKGNVVNAFTVETGDGALPPGMSDTVFKAAVDLMCGRKTVAQTTALLDKTYDQLANG